jgi:hypothetical protein
MKPTYEEYANELGGDCIKATYENGVVVLIPRHLANSDYQAYLESLKS